VGETFGLFEHPARLFFSCQRLTGYRGSIVPKRSFRSLSAVRDPFMTVHLFKMIDDIAGFRKNNVSVLEDRDIILA
jgi:hypothetical protein